MLYANVSHKPLSISASTAQYTFLADGYYAANSELLPFVGSGRPLTQVADTYPDTKDGAAEAIREVLFEAPS